MAQKDILLRAGITFSANDIDTKAIKAAITKSVANTALNIKKAKFGPTAKTALRTGFEKIGFRVNKATFGRSGQSSLRQKFRELVFSIGSATFSATALKQLNAQLGLNQFKLNRAQQQQSQQRRGAGRQASGLSQASTTGTRSFNEAIKEQGQLFGRTLQDAQAYNAVVSEGQKRQLSFQKTIAQGGQSLQGFGANIAKITTRFTAYLASLRAIFLVQQAFSKSLEVIVKFDATIQDLNKVLIETPQGLQDVSAGLFQVAEATGQSVFAVAESFGIFRRAVDNNEEALRRTSAALIAVNISELTVAESTRLVTSAMNIFGAELNNEIEALDILSVTADNAATTAAQLGRGVLRSGAAAQAVGVSFKELNAIIAATEEATKLGGAQIGSALKTIFARLASNSDQLRRNANALGGNLRASDSVFETLQKLAQIFPTLNREQKAQLTQIVAGKRRFTEFNAIVSSFNKTQELLEKQSGATGTALRKNEEELDTLQVATQQLRNQFTQLVVTLSGADQGADAVSTIREAIAEVLEVISSGVKLTNQFFKALGGLENLGAALTGTFVTLVKVGLFRLGPAILGQLISGAKAFLGVGQQITTIIKAQAGAQQGIISNQTKILSQLDQEKLKREQIAAVNRQFVGTGLPTGAAGGAGRFGLAQPFGGTKAVGFEKITRGLTTSFNAAGSTIKRGASILRQGLERDSKGITAGSIGFALLGGAAASSLKAFADDIDKTNDGVSTLGTDFTRLSASAAQSAITFGLLLGPVGALTAAILVASKGLLDLGLETIAEGSARRVAIEELKNDTETLGGALATAGTDGARIFNKLLQSSARVGSEQVNQIVFFKELSKEINSGTDSLSKFVGEASDSFDELSRAVAANARALDLQKSFDKVTEGIRKKILTFNVEADAGKLTGVLKEAAGIAVDLELSTSRFSSLVDDTNSGITVQARLANVVKEALDGSTRSTLELFQDNLLITDEVRKQNKFLTDQTRIFEEEIQLGQASERIASARLKNLQSELAQRQELLKRTKEELQERESTLSVDEARQRGLVGGENDIFKVGQKVNNLRAETVELQKEVNALSKAALETEQAITKSTELEKNAQSELAKISQQRSALGEDLLENAKETVILGEKSSKIAELINAQAEALITTTNLETAALQKNLNVNREIARQQLAGGTLEQRLLVETAAIRKREQDKIDAFQIKQLAGIKKLRDDAEKAGGAQGEAFEAAADAAEAQLPAQVDALTQKAEIQIQLNLVDVNKRQIEQAENALQQFRLNNIQQLLDNEVQFANERINLIKQLQETQAGRDFLQEEFSPQPGLERQFGFFNAAIIESLTDAADASTEAILKEFDELRVGGVFAVEDLARASEAFFNAEKSLADLRRSGGGTEEIAQAEADFDRVRERLQTIANSGADAFERLEFTQSAINQIVRQEEQRTAEIRKIALERAQEAAKRVAEAEKNLVTERNKIPALNARVIAANKTLSQAQDRVGDATRSLVAANQELADEQFKLAFNIGLAEIKARTAGGSLSTTADKIDALATAFRTAANEANASTDTILEARRRLLQQELSLIESQLQSVQSLALKAATADANELARLQQAGAAAASITAGTAEVADFPPEIIQSLGELTDFFPGLERSILEFGAQRLGIDPSVFQSFEDRLVEANVAIAETGQSQVDAAQAGVRAAQLQLEETRQQRDIAQQSLDVAISQRDAGLQAVAQAGANLAVNRAGFAQITQQTAKSLNEFRAGRVVSEQARAAIDLLKRAQEAALGEIQAQKLIAQEALGITKEQTVAINETRIEQTATKDKVAEGVQKQEETNTILTTGFGALEDAFRASQQGQGIVGSLLAGVESFINNLAGGNLSGNEIAGLMSAAKREKAAMPTGSRLMLANTSETVIPRKTVKRIRRAAGGNIPNAQGGNLNGDIESAVASLANETSSLRQSIGDLARSVSAQGPIQVNLDSNRTLTVNGLSELPQAIESAIVQRLGDTPSQAEVTAIRQSVVDVLARLRENGLEDFAGLGV